MAQQKTAKTVETVRLPVTPNELFRELVKKNVNEKTEKKGKLTYLSWTWAWQEFKLICPTATYQIGTFEDGNGRLRPYMDCGDDMGYMCFTSITALDQTHEMWLPVMDGANNAMKSKPYTYKVKKYVTHTDKSGNVLKDKWGNDRLFWDGEYEDKTVEAATSFDINKTIMRCLVKNIAMFGLGIYIYAGEDLPLEISEPCTPKQIEKMRELNVILSGVQKKFGVNSFEELTFEQAKFIITAKENGNIGKEATVKSTVIATAEPLPEPPPEPLLEKAAFNFFEGDKRQ